MRRVSPTPKAPRGSRLGAAIGLALSLALHALAYAVLSWAGRGPSLDFELTLPAEIELGVTDAVAVEPPPPAAEPPPPPAPSPEPPAPRASDEPAPKRVDAGAPTDAAIADAAIATDATPADAAPAGGDGSIPDAGDGDAGRALLAAYAPEGAQIALRLHMARIRDSPLAADVRRLLAAVPDWQLILQGSGIDPLAQLERVFIASPNLQRSSVVIAGQYAGDDSIARAAVERLAAESGQPARWRKRGGVAFAPWRNRDTTERVLALIAPQQFVIARPDDLPRVLAIARALAARRAPADAGSAASAAEALLALPAGQTLALSIEGLRNFVRGNLRGIPERFEAGVEQPDRGPLRVRMRGSFEDEGAARQALDYWRQMQRRAASHPLVAFVGIRAPIAGAKLEVDEREVRVETAVTLAQARLVLEFIRNALEPPATQAPGAQTPIAPPIPPPAPPKPPRVPDEHKRGPR